MRCLPISQLTLTVIHLPTWFMLFVNALCMLLQDLGSFSPRSSVRCMFWIIFRTHGGDISRYYWRVDHQVESCCTCCSLLVSMIGKCSTCIVCTPFEHQTLLRQSCHRQLLERMDILHRLGTRLASWKFDMHDASLIVCVWA